ncbi:MAG TPA: hypothetical protein VIM57_05025 [Luteolibacter sp.]
MRLWLIPLCCVLPLASCGKIRAAVNKAKSAVGNATDKGGSESEAVAVGGPVDAGLGALVDRDANGFRFRKDQGFPTRLQVRKVSSVRYHNVRVMRRSALGTENLSMDGTTETISQWRLKGDRLEIALEKMTFTLPPEKMPKPDGKNPNPSVQTSPVAQAIPMERMAQMKGTFVKTGKGWGAENARSGDFLRATWLQKMEPGVDALAIEAGVLPRTMWFGKPRWKEGASMTLEGENLRMIETARKVKGKVQMLFEGEEAVGGHPCARFSVSGNYSAEDRATEDGGKSDLDVTISSGKIWFSLIHPLVVRQELDTVITLSTESDGVPTKIQGRAVVTSTLEWKPES